MSLQKINEKLSKKKFQNRKNFRNLIMSKKKIKFKNIFIIVYSLLTVIIINNVYAKETFIFTQSKISYVIKKKF